MNKVLLMGRLTKDPEIRYSRSENSIAVGRYTLAVSKRFKKQGEPEADFIPCIVFGKNAEWSEKYLKKGMQISIVGRIQVRPWTDTDGNKRISTDIVVEETYFAESKAAKNGSTLDDFYPIDESIEDSDLPF